LANNLRFQIISNSCPRNTMAIYCFRASQSEAGELGGELATSKLATSKLATSKLATCKLASLCRQVRVLRVRPGWRAGDFSRIARAAPAPWRQGWRAGPLRRSSPNALGRTMSAGSGALLAWWSRWQAAGELLASSAGQRPASMRRTRVNHAYTERIIFAESLAVIWAGGLLLLLWLQLCLCLRLWLWFRFGCGLFCA